MDIIYGFLPIVAARNIEHPIDVSILFLLQYHILLCWSSLQSCSLCLRWDTWFLNYLSLLTNQLFHSIRGGMWNSLQGHLWSLKPRPWKNPISDPFRCLTLGKALLG